MVIPARQSRCGTQASLRISALKLGKIEIAGALMPAGTRPETLLVDN